MTAGWERTPDGRLFVTREDGSQFEEVYTKEGYSELIPGMMESEPRYELIGLYPSSSRTTKKVGKKPAKKVTKKPAKKVVKKPVRNTTFRGRKK